VTAKTADRAGRNAADVPAGPRLRGQAPAPRAVNQLKAVIVTADPALRDTLTGLNTTALIRRCANLPDTAPSDVATATSYTLRHLAMRIQFLTAEERPLQRQMTTVLNTHAPQLLQRHGIGPDSAAALLVTAGDNPDRLESEASFAALCGVSPIEASSGKTRRHRLNRGGDRRANAALHRIALTRSRGDHRTRTYLQHRTNHGSSRREAFRCLIGEVFGFAAPIQGRGSLERQGRPRCRAGVYGQFEFCRSWRAEVCRPALGTRPGEGRTMRVRRADLHPVESTCEAEGGSACSSAGTGPAPPTT